MDEAIRREGCQACRDDQAEFTLAMAFQPVVDVQLRRIDAYEALVRGPQGQSAASVLGAVTAGNIYSFDQTCRVRAIESAARLGMACRLNINFLPNAVYEPRACIRRTLQAAERTGFPAQSITFEITEQERLTDTAHLRGIIAAYKDIGFQIALDDFTTGYSGIGRLVDLHPDVVKLDRSLIADCDRDPRRRAVIAGLLGVCAAIGIKPVMEGVERAEEVAALRDLGARYMQGYYFARPALEALAAEADIAWGDAG